MQSRDLRLSPAEALCHAGRLVFLTSGKSCRPEFETSAQAFLLNPADEWKSIFNCVHPEALWHFGPNQKLLCDANCCKRQLISQPRRIQRAAADNTAFPSLGEMLDWRVLVGASWLLHSHQEGNNQTTRAWLKYPSRKKELSVYQDP